MTVVRVGWHRAGTDAERLAFDTGMLIAGDVWVCTDTGEMWSWVPNDWVKVATAIPAFSLGPLLLNSAGVEAVTLMVWRCTANLTLTKIYAWRTGGSGVEINARRNGGPTTHLAANFQVSSAGTWMDAGAVQDADYVAGDTLEIIVAAPAGSPTQVGVQLDFEPA